MKEKKIESTVPVFFDDNEEDLFAETSKIFKSDLPKDKIRLILEKEKSKSIRTNSEIKENF